MSRVENQNGNNWKGLICHCIVTTLMVWGVAGCSFPILSGWTNRAILLMAGLAACFVLELEEVLPKLGVFLYPGMGILCVAFLFLRCASIVNGLLLSFNRYIEIWNERFHDSRALLRVENGVASDCIYFWILLVLLYAMLSDVVVSRGWRIIGTLLDLAVILFVGGLGISRSEILILGIFCGWFLQMLLERDRFCSVWRMLACVIPAAVFCCALVFGNMVLSYGKAATFRRFGVLLMGCYVLFFVVILLEIQRLLRIRSRASRIARADMARYSQPYLELLIKLCPLERSEEQPDASCGSIGQQLAGFSYHKTLRLLQRSSSEDQKLTWPERRCIRVFLTDMETAVKKGCRSPLIWLYYRYYYAL